MPKVAIIGTRGYPSYYGGFETAVRKLAPYLIDHGCDVTVYSRPGATAADSATRDDRVRVVESRGIDRKSVSTLSFGLTAALHAAREKPDVALVMNVANGYWLPILKRAGIPTLVNVDGIEWDRAKWGRLAKWVFRTGAKLSAKHGTELVYDSREIARHWKSEFHRDGIFIPYGGDMNDTAWPVEPGLTHRAYVLVVARFVPENSVPEFFAAIPEIAEKWDVVIVGSSGYGGHLDTVAEQLARDHERVRWLGHVSDDDRLHSLWQHAGVYFHGHTVGGTNPALVQAMASGAPVLARSTPYNLEVLDDATALIDLDRTNIATSVLGALEDRQRIDSMADKNYLRASSEYTWESVNQRYLTALERIARR